MMKVEFWAKTTPDEKPGIPVSQHMANVGYVARCLAETAPDLMERFQIRFGVVGQ
jgi:CRISPR-associated endonuclease/helicase Cas3